MGRVLRYGRQRCQPLLGGSRSPKVSAVVAAIRWFRRCCRLDWESSCSGVSEMISSQCCGPSRLIPPERSIGCVTNSDSTRSVDLWGRVFGRRVGPAHQTSQLWTAMVSSSVNPVTNRTYSVDTVELRSDTLHTVLLPPTENKSRSQR